MALTFRVVVVAGSAEGLDALMRLINSLPSTFPVPVVAHVHGLNRSSLERLMRSDKDVSEALRVVLAGPEQRLQPGCFYVAPEGNALAFTSIGMVNRVDSAGRSSADRLFESAAHWYQAGAVGVVLSGLGSDGTRGLQAISCQRRSKPDPLSPRSTK